jgi:Na+-driven multidrug efflux pump
VFIWHFDATDAVKIEAIKYVKTYSIAIVTMIATWALIGALKGLQIVKILPAISGFTIFTNIILNFILVYGVKMGIAGSGLGTSITNIMGALILLYFFAKEVKKVKKVSYKPHIKSMLSMLKNGFPLSVRSVVFWVGLLVYAYAVSGLGTDYLAADQVLVVIYMFTWFMFDALSSSCQTLIGEAQGAGDKEKSLQIIKRVSRMIKILLIAGFVIMNFSSIILTPVIIPSTYIHSIVVLITVIASFTILPIYSRLSISEGILLGFNKNKFLLLTSILPTIIAIGLMLGLMNLHIKGMLGMILMTILYDVLFCGLRAIFAWVGIKKISRGLNSTDVIIGNKNNKIS